MKFVAFDQPAAEEITSDRFLQSVEFEPGRALGALLSQQAKKIALGPKICIANKDNGIFIIGNMQDGDNLFVIDEENARVFLGRSEADCLLVFQKLCRYAVRQWKRLRLSRNELPIPNSTKTVVFPFPISNQTSYRIVIEREPDRKRLERRSAGTYLLAYRSGTTEGDGPTEVAPLTEFRKAVKSISAVREQLCPEIQPANSPAVRTLRVTELDIEPTSLLPPQQGFNRWLGLLTEKQKAFVEDKLSSPHRIEGPAGTGKTLCLILKSINELQSARLSSVEHHAIFIAHSESTRKSIQDLFDANDEDNLSRLDRYTSRQSLRVTTLHELCTDLLNTEISETEFLDRDAMESKNAQLLYVEEALKETLERDFTTHKPFLSADFSNILANEELWTLAEMFQHEISVVIKGRAEEDLNKYRRLPFLKYGLPLRSESDRGFAFLIFKSYQEKLHSSAQFDTDDIVLTATGQLNTPIWRRRRTREGYDSLYVDETHLFNMNELSIFHYLTKNESTHPIAYSVDKSQSLGDKGWEDASFTDALSGQEGVSESLTVIRSVFRCAPEIVNFAFAITSSGATLFTNFEDPLRLAASTFTDNEERKSSIPNYHSCPTDVAMISESFAMAEKLTRDLDCSRHEILIAIFDPVLMEEFIREANLANKPVEIITRRGDIEVIKRAERGGRFVIGLADYVGGLEFDAVVLVGVDHGRVPPARNQTSSESSNFLSYSAHSRLYVSITRAKYRVEVFGANDRGPSRLLSPAFANGAILKAEDAESHGEK